MKPNIILSLISIIAAALFAFLFYLLSDEKGNMLKALAISGFITMACCLEGGIGLSWKDKKHQVNALAASFLFFLIFLVEHCCFAVWGDTPAWLVITSGLLLMLYTMIMYGIKNAKM